MTTSVTVRTRALGAAVQVGDETTDIGPHREHTFHIDGGSQSFTVTQNEQPASESFVDEATGTDSADVPGRSQNDELLGRGKQKGSGSGTSASSAQPPVGSGE